MRETGPLSLLRPTGEAFLLPLKYSQATDVKLWGWQEKNVWTVAENWKGATKLRWSNQKSELEPVQLKKRQSIFVIRDFALRSTEAPICCPDNHLRSFLSARSLYLGHPEEATRCEKAGGLLSAVALSSWLTEGCN